MTSKSRILRANLGRQMKGSWPDHTPDYYLLMVSYSDGTDRGYRLSGDAALLAAAEWENETPIGILLDRLQECPEECEAPAEVVAAAVEWLRERHPNGV